MAGDTVKAPSETPQCGLSQPHWGWPGESQKPYLASVERMFDPKAARGYRGLSEPRGQVWDP